MPMTNKTLDPRFMPEVLQVVPGKGYTLYAYFNDGTIRRYDASGLVKGPGVLRKLSDPSVFRGRLTVLNGTAAWDLTGKHNPADCVDIDPLEIYDSPVVPDPLERKDWKEYIGA